MMGDVMHSDAKISAWIQRHLASIQGEVDDGLQSFGAGIAVSRNCVVTAYHVARAVATWGARGDVVRVKIGAESTDGVVLHWDQVTDLALVSLDRPIAEPAVFLFGMQGLLSQQPSDVIALGFPHNSGDRNQPEQARFAPDLFDLAQMRYRIDAGSGLDEGFSGGPFVLGDHPDMPVVGLTQKGGASGITILRHATEVVRYVMAHGLQPMLMPAWKMPQYAAAESKSDAFHWAKALDLPGTILNWVELPALAKKPARFRLLPIDLGLPVLMMDMVTTRQHFGLDRGGCVMTGLVSPKQLEHLSARAAEHGLRIPHRDEWESAFRPPNKGAPEPWPPGSEFAPTGTVPPQSKIGPFGIQMAPPGHWEVVSSDRSGSYELMAPPTSPGGNARSIDLQRQMNPRAVVLRFCIDLPLPRAVANAKSVKWEGG